MSSYAGIDEVEIVKRLFGNHYRWYYATFCQSLGLTQNEYSEELWQAFKDAVRALAKFDDKNLKAIFSV
jgi:hypothetical protein